MVVHWSGWTPHDERVRKGGEQSHHTNGQKFALCGSEYTPRIHWVVRGTATPKNRDEVIRREVYECDG